MFRHRAFIVFASVPLGTVIMKLLQLLRSPRLTPDGNVAPKVIHRILTKQSFLPGRTIIVGDVHGCLEELDILLERCGYTSEDNLILAGDMVNKGPFSQEVVQKARELGALVVRGNHDDAALAAYHQYQEVCEAKQQGKGAARVCNWWPCSLWGSTGQRSLRSLPSSGRLPRPKQIYRLPKYRYVESFSEEDVKFLEELPFTLTLEPYGLVVVHAGLVPGVPLQQQTMLNMFKMRTVKKDASGRWVAEERTSEDGSVPWAQVWTGPQHVVFGHDARRRLQLRTCATGLDTGACYGGQLTALVLPPLDKLGPNLEMIQKKMLNGMGITREDLQAEVVSVDALHTYEEPKNQ